MPASTVNIIALYSTLPIQKIIAIADVIANISNHPSQLWKITEKGGCISRVDFDNYFDGLSIVHAFQLDNIRKLIVPLSLNAINTTLSSPPQSFRYLKDSELNIIFQNL
jgi:predicted transcriptional regulator